MAPTQAIVISLLIIKLTVSSIVNCVQSDHFQVDGCVDGLDLLPTLQCKFLELSTNFIKVAELLEERQNTFEKQISTLKSYVSDHDLSIKKIGDSIETEKSSINDKISHLETSLKDSTSRTRTDINNKVSETESNLRKQFEEILDTKQKSINVQLWQLKNDLIANYSSKNELQVRIKDQTTYLITKISETESSCKQFEEQSDKRINTIDDHLSNLSISTITKISSLTKFGEALEKRQSSIDDRMSHLNDLQNTFKNQTTHLDTKMKEGESNFKTFAANMNKRHKTIDDQFLLLNTSVITKFASLEKISENLGKQQSSIEDQISSLKNDAISNYSKLRELQSEINVEISHLRAKESEVKSNFEKLEKRFDSKASMSSLVKLENNIDGRQKIIETKIDTLGTSVRDNKSSFKKSEATLEKRLRMMDDQISHLNVSTLQNFRELSETRLKALDKRLSHLKTADANESTMTKYLRQGLDSTNSCYEGKKSSGLISLKIPPKATAKVFCESTTRGGGWIVIQQRIDKKVHFDRGWGPYKNGFGQPESNFWIGLEKIHQLTSHDSYELLIELRFHSSGDLLHAFYSQFRIGSEKEKYALVELGSFSGTAGDALSSHKGRQFSTRDRQNVPRAHILARKHKGGWWYYDGFQSQLNSGFDSEFGIFWKTPRLSFARMMIRKS